MMTIKWGELRNDSRGLSTVEYVLLLVLIAAGSIAAWRDFGSALVKQVRGQAGEISNLNKGSGGGGANLPGFGP